MHLVPFLLPDLDGVSHGGKRRRGECAASDLDTGVGVPGRNASERGADGRTTRVVRAGGGRRCDNHRVEVIVLLWDERSLRRDAPRTFPTT